MKVNYPVIILSAIITAVLVTVILKLAGSSMGIPESWNPAISGGLAAGVSLMLGQLFAKKDTAEANES